jgi:hypothetical protein
MDFLETELYAILLYSMPMAQAMHQERVNVCLPFFHHSCDSISSVGVRL